MIKIDSEIEINAPINVVASYASNPDNEPQWFKQTASVEWKTEKPLNKGSIINFYARPRFMGIYNTFEYTEVIRNEKIMIESRRTSTLIPTKILITYSFHAINENKTKVSLTVKIHSLLFWIFSPIYNFVLRKNYQNALEKMKSLIEENNVVQIG